MSWTVTPGDVVPSTVPPGTIDGSVYGRSAVVYSVDWTQPWYGGTGNAYGPAVSVRNMPSGAPQAYERIGVYIMGEQFDPSSPDITRDLVNISNRMTIKSGTPYGRGWTRETILTIESGADGYVVADEVRTVIRGGPDVLDPDALNARVPFQMIADTGLASAGLNFISQGGRWGFPLRVAEGVVAAGGAAIRIDKQVAGSDALRIAADTWSTFVAQNGARYTAFGFLGSEGTVHVGDPKADTRLGDGHGNYVSVAAIKQALSRLGQNV